MIAVRYFRASTQWIMLVSMLAFDSFDERYKRSRWAAFFALGEPLGVIAILSLAQSLTMNPPPYGSSSILFFSTGILSYYLFFHLSLKLRNLDSFRVFPRTTLFDRVLARAMGELCAKSVILIVCCLLLASFGNVREAWPANVDISVAAWLILAVLGISAGLVNAVISAGFAGWMYIYALVVRLLMVFSGAMMVVDHAPPNLREWLLWNPLTHAIILFRLGFYENYPTSFLDVSYLVMFTAVFFILALFVEASTRSWRRAKR